MTVFDHEELRPVASSFNVADTLYLPLLPGYIRILEVLPGKPNDDIQCRLHTAVLVENKFAYDALSYTWEMNGPESSQGDSQSNGGNSSGKNTRMFFACTGVTALVQENLYNALQRLRDDEDSKYIWVDALCINQDDLVERAQQVHMMNAIYTYAYQVLIWLGEEHDPYDIFASISMLVHFWAAEHVLGDMIPSSRYPSNSQEYDSDVYGIHGAGSARLPRGVRSLNLEAIEALYNCRWFQRVWVLQEIALARSATVLYGQRQISWDYIGIAASIIRTNYNYLSAKSTQLDKREMPIGLRNAYLMYRISKSQRLFEPLRFSLHQLLQLTRQFQCKQSRDKVFGLLAIPTTDDMACKIVVNYEKSDAAIFRDVALTLIMQTRSLHILSSVQCDFERGASSCRDKHPEIKPIYSGSLYNTDWPRPSSSKSPSIDLPSWVPQWDNVYTQALISLEPDESFAASGSRVAEIQPVTDLSRLSIRGASIDKAVTVTYLGPNDFFIEPEYPYGLAHGQMPPNITPSEYYENGLPNFIWPERSTIMPVTKDDLSEIAATLTGGKNWYGLPIEDSRAHLADFAKCLIGGALRWSLNEDVYGGVSDAHKDEQHINVYNLNSRLSVDGDMNRFRDAAFSACRERACFRTASGMRGLGPAAMRPGDQICILYGASMPFVIRPHGNAYKLIGECYVHSLMRGQGVPENLVNEEPTWIDLV